MTIEKNGLPEVTEILHSRWLKNYIRVRISTLKLSSHISEEDVIQHAAAECAIKYFNSGQRIEYPITWAKLVSERYINKLYKKNRNSEATDSEKLEYLANIAFEERNLRDSENQGQLHQSIRQLKSASRQIIELRFIQELHWDQIAEILSCQENRVICIATARKRGERALRELKKIYLAS
jgi:RNA polymerase sigma factor (sigma-70 family)